MILWVLLLGCSSRPVAQTQPADVLGAKLGMPFEGHAGFVPQERVGSDRMLVWVLEPGTEILAPASGLMVTDMYSAHCSESDDHNEVPTLVLFGPEWGREPAVVITGVDPYIKEKVLVENDQFVGRGHPHINKGDPFGVVVNSQCPGLGISIHTWDTYHPLSMGQAGSSPFDVSTEEWGRLTHPTTSPEARHLVFGKPSPRGDSTLPVRLTAVPFDTFSEPPARGPASRWLLPVGATVRSPITGAIRVSDVYYRCAGTTRSHRAFSIVPPGEPRIKITVVGVERGPSNAYSDKVFGGMPIGTIAKTACPGLLLELELPDGHSAVTVDDPKTSPFKVSPREWKQLTGPERLVSGPALEVLR